MVRLVDVLVHARVVLKTVDPVDGKVIERHVQHRGHNHPGPAVLAYMVVEQAVSTDLGQEDGQREEVDKGDRG